MIDEPRRHVRDGRFGQMEHGRDVGLEGVVPLFVGDLFQRLAGHLVGGVVHEDVDLAERFYGGGDDVPAVLGIGDVAADEDGFAARLLDEPGRVLGVAVLVEVGDEHVSAFAGESDGHRPADAAVTAGDDAALPASRSWPT